MFVGSFEFRNVHGIYVKVLVKFSLVVISREPMIRNHSYLDHWYPIEVALFP